MKEYYMPKEMMDAGDEFHEPMQEYNLARDEFVHGVTVKKTGKKKSLVSARKLFYLLAGSATIASIGLLSK